MIFVAHTAYYEDSSIEFVTTNVEYLIDCILKDTGDKIKVNNVDVSIWKDEIELRDEHIYRVSCLYNLLTKFARILPPL